ncbi:zinc finger, CCHC-type containing protein [Tanacetum coccineum]
MGDTNPIRTLGDYSRPSHEGYRNTIELPEGNNVVPLRSDTIRLADAHSTDFASNWLERLPAGSISTWEDLTTRFLAQFFPLGRTAKLRLTLKSPSSWHRLLASSSIFYDHVSFHLKCEIDRAAGGKLRDKNADETEEIIENLALYDHEAGMTQMFGLLKELTTSRALKKVLIREEAKHPVTKNVNFISLIRGEEETNADDNATSDDSIERPNRSDTEVQLNEVKKENEAENGTKNNAEKEPIQVEEEESVKAPSSQPVGYYLNHRITEKLIEGLVENHRFNDSLSAARVGKMKQKTYILLPRGPGYEAILKIAEDVLVDVAGYVYPVDFVILDIKEDEKRPFIIGTPFLTTAKAVIKFDKGTITLRSGKSKMSFHRIPEPLCKIEKGIKNNIEPIAPTVTVNKLGLEWEERIKLHQEKEMKFNQWRRKNFENKHLTFVKAKREVKNKGEVT